MTDLYVFVWNALWLNWMKRRRDGSRESELGTVFFVQRTSTPRSPEASISANLVDETSSRSKLNDQGSDLSSDSEEKEPQVPNKKRRKQNEDGHSKNPEKTAVKGKKRGRQATWLEIQVTDMVNIIVNDENILRKLVFTNTKTALGKHS